MVYFRCRMVGKQKRISIAAALVLFVCSFLAISFIAATPTYAQPSNTNNTNNTTATSPPGTKCAIERIGWILCPLIEGSAKVADFSFQFLANHLLTVEPELLTAEPAKGAGTITAWKEARNIANILFVIAFIFIVYSQITGSGLNNYGIKRMLPRLILAAIAVNVSYYICQTAVDLSNILGRTIMDALIAITNRISDQQVMSLDPTKAINTQTGGTAGIIASIAVASLAVAGIIWLVLPILGSIVVFVVVTCVTIILILLLRKAFIVLLVVMSPLAFVMYLLPNTEKYFSKWLDMFWKLLLVFPVVALLMGSGQLASTVILAAGAEGKPCDPTANTNGADADASKIKKDEYAVEDECSVDVNGKQVGTTLGLVAAGVAVAPLIAVWSVLQGALSAAGAIGGKIGGAINNMNKGSRARMGNAMKDRREELAERRGLNAMRSPWSASNIMTGGSIRRKARRGAVRGNIKSETQRATEDMVADRITDSDRFRRRMAGGAEGAEDRLRASVAGIEHKRQEEETKNQQALYQQMLNDKRGNGEVKNGRLVEDHDRIENELRSAIRNQDKAGIHAATSMLMNMGGPGRERLRSVMQTHGADQSAGAMMFRSNITSDHGSLKATDADVYAAASDASAQGLDYHRGLRETFDSLTNDQLATQSLSSLGSRGSQAAMHRGVDIVDEQGRRHTVSRGSAVLASKAGSEIKGSNRDAFTQTIDNDWITNNPP